MTARQAADVCRPTAISSPPWATTGHSDRQPGCPA